MINYSNYKTDDYLADESFRQWVLDGGLRNAETQWSQWLNAHPEHQREALSAREIILAANIREEPFADSYFETISRETIIAVRKEKKTIVRRWVWNAAATVALVSGILGWYTWQGRSTQDIAIEETASQSASEKKFARANHTETLLPVALPDGSSVLLHPNSNLTYRKLPNGYREVTLTGKAFFEVTKDPSNPFIVYSGEMVTKVLGTSFTITAYEKDADFSVVVKTGKVAVSRMENLQKESKSNPTVNLVPNEQLVFDRENSLFKTKDLPENDMLKFVPATPGSYTFEDAPVADVFRKIGEAYGLKIDLDTSVFTGCELTTNLADEPLFEKLNIVCNAVGPGTSYVVEDGHIRVVSSGCNQ